MLINRIVIKNVRGKTFDLQLGPLNLIIGPNKSGKTTIADCLRFVLLGYIPGMPKPPREWNELLSEGESGTVEIYSDIGQFKRYITLQAGGSVKVEPVGPIAECDLPVNTLAIDQAAFFNATGPEQAEMLAKASSEDIKWVELVSEQLKQKYPIGTNKLGVEFWYAWVYNAIDTADAFLKSERSKKAMYTQTMRGLESIRETVIPDAVQKENELQALREQLGAKKHALELLNAQTSKPVNVSKAASCELERIKMQLPPVRPAEKTWKKRVENNEENISVLKETKGFLEPEQYAKLSSEHGAALRERSDAILRETELQDRIDNIKTRYAEMLKKGKCPTCGHAGTGFKVNLELLQNAELEPLIGQLVTVEKQKARAISLSKKLHSKIEIAREINAKLTTEYQIERALRSEQTVIALWKRHDELVAKVKEEEANAPDSQASEEAKYDLENEIEEISGQIVALGSEVRNISHARSQKRQLVETEEKLQESEKEASRLAQQIGDLKILRDAFMRMSLRPILQKVGLFTKGIFDTDLQLDNTEIGRFVGSKWVPLRQFSGSEQMVAMAALNCALATEGENYVVMDELGIMDNGHLSTFLTNLHGAIKQGVITQFVGLSTPRSVLFNSAKIKSIDLTKATK